MGFSKQSICISILSLLLICHLNFVQSSFVETVYTATLTPQQVQPDNGIDNLSFNGAVICVYSRYTSPIQLDCEIQHNIGHNVTEVQIRKGARGENGPLVFQFTSTKENARQVFTFNAIEGFSAAELQSSYLNGYFYIQVNTDSYPSGLIRGQIEHKDRAYARLNAKNTIPSSSGTTATGIALATYSFYSPNRLLQIDVVHNIVDPTYLDLSVGLSNQIGDTAYTFTNAHSPVFDFVSLSLVENKNLFDDLLYLNFKSTSNPTGDIRGALISIDYPLTISYSASLSGSGEYSGGALVSYNCKSQILEYLIIHNIPDASSAFLNQGDIPLFPLSSGKSPIYGSIAFPSDNLNALNEKLLSFIVSGGSGTITGPINTDIRYWTYMTGTNELPSITTDNEGLALYTVGSNTDSNRQVQYQIYHSVTNPTSIKFRYGSEGNTGPILAALDEITEIVNGANVTSPLKGTFVISNTDYQNYWKNGAVYIEITTPEYPLGFLRGQIFQLDPCVLDYSPQTIITKSIDVLTYFDSFYPTLSIVVIASSNAVVIEFSFIFMLISLLLTI